MYTFIKQEHTKLIKSDSKAISKVTKISSLNKCRSFELSIYQRILKVYHCFHKNIKQSKQMFFLSIQISIKEWFLKDHLILETGVMMLKIQFASQE